MKSSTQSDLHAQRRTRWRVHALALSIVLLASVLLKLSIWQQHPQIFNDSPSYLVPAVALLDGRGYGIQQDGFRQPTFPLYLALLLAPFDRTHLNDCTDAHRSVCIGRAAEQRDGQIALRVIVLANILFGLGIVVLLYVLGWDLTHNIFAAALFGAGYALNLSTAYWEISILTETVTTFLLLCALYLTLRAHTHGGWATVTLGIVLAVLALCHQLFLVYSIVPMLYLLVRRWRAGWLHALRRVAPVVLLPAVAVGLWSTWNYFVNGAFTPSTVGGYVLIQMVYPVAENAPEGYDGITQTLVGYRDAQIQQTGKPTGAVFRAWRDMMKETDFTFAQVGSKLTALSLYLIWHYPQAYWSAIQESWARFWDFALFHYDPIPEGVAAVAASFADSTLQTILNVLFWLSPLVLAGIAAWQVRARHEIVPTDALWGAGLLCATVWFAAIMSSLTNLGDNSRYRVTVMPLQYGVDIFIVWALVTLVGRRRAESESI